MDDIKNLQTYSPEEQTTPQLQDDWRIVMAWWAQIREGREFTFSKEQVIDVASLIYQELKKRNIEFHPETMKPHSKELFNIVSKGKITPDDEEFITEISGPEDLAPVQPSGEKMGDRLYLKDVLPYFKSFYTSRPHIDLVGGLANHPQDGTEGDIDILVRALKPKGNEGLPLIFRLYRMIPEDLRSRLQILWSNDDWGPFTNHVPLYDLRYQRRLDKEIVLMSEDDQQEETVPFEPGVEDALRSKKPEILSMAKESSERGIKPFRFFEMLKGIAGYRKLEKFTPEGVLSVTKAADYPYEVDQKFDGMRIQLHKKGSKVKIYSIDGANLTSKLDIMAQELKKYKYDVVLDAEVTGWTKGWRKGEHLGRSDVAGFIHSKAGLPHRNFFANTFDILFIDGKQLHDKPLAERRATLERLPKGTNVRIIPMEVAKNATELKNAIKWASKLPASEGAMIKSLKSAYPLRGLTSKWIKFKKEADLDAEVVQVHKVKNQPGTFNYLSILRTSRGDPVPVGRTYNTKIKAQVGDIIRVAFVNINEYTDPDTNKVWYNWWSPRVLELREDKDTPDNDNTARELVRETHGEIGQKKWPKRYAQLLDDDDEDLDYETAAMYYSIDANPYMTPGDEDKKWSFVVQNHFRGKSLHQDLRMERPSFLVGFTLNIQKKGKPSEDIDTVEKAKAFSKNKSDIKDLKRSKQQIVAETKSPQPLPWLKVEGVTEKGEVGATKLEEGVYDIVAKGEIEFGTQKPDFHEYWLHDDKNTYDYSGRLVVRLLKNIWSPELTGRGKFVWMAWFTKDEKPYILSKRAVDLGWMPPQGLSALPRKLRKNVPKELQYWKHKGQGAKERRDNLSKLYRTGKLKLDQEEEDSFPGGKYTLSRICWRGQMVVRGGCSREEHHIFLATKGDKVKDIILNGNPAELGKVSAVLGEDKNKSVMSMEGEVPNETALNPDKETPATIEILEKGEYKSDPSDPNRIKFHFRGPKMKGDWILTRTRPKTTLWVFKKVEE